MRIPRCILNHRIAAQRFVTFQRRLYERRPPRPSTATHPQQQRHVSTTVVGGRDDYSSTIYALSTAPGRAAIAIIRISGPLAQRVYTSLCPAAAPPLPRLASVRTLHSPPPHPSAEPSVLDASALTLFFPAAQSATGEDVLELHVHGGPAIVSAVLGAVPLCAPASGNAIRYAEPGEFTRRAFFNGRLRSLVQVEALADALSAVTEQQRRLAVRGAGGKNAAGDRYEAWREELLAARGELEALIDFSEDQHFDESPRQLMGSVAGKVRRLRRRVGMQVVNAARGELLRSGIRVALLGAPNVGKSSVLNAVVGREAAIVSGTAGTTRDVVEVGMDVGGYLCRFADTAGLRGEEVVGVGEVEVEGMRRARARAKDSDLVVVVVAFDEGGVEVTVDEEVAAAAEEMLALGKEVLVLVNKRDLLPEDGGMLEGAARAAIHAAIPSLHDGAVHLTSCTVDDSSAALLAVLTATFEDMTRAVTTGEADKSVWQESLGATERQRLLLDECAAHLNAFLELASPSDNQHDDEQDVDFVLAAEYLRSAATCLARITGRGEGGDVEDVLGVVFEKFCVGK